MMRTNTDFSDAKVLIFKYHITTIIASILIAFCNDFITLTVLQNDIEVVLKCKAKIGYLTILGVR